jgi:hypothetical protein
MQVTELAKSLIDQLHGVATILSVLSTAAGVVGAVSTKWVAERTIDKLKDKITAEANRNFQIETHDADGNLVLVSPNDHAKIHTGVRTRDAAYVPPKETSTDIAKKQVRVRLEDIIEERERQESTSKWLGITSTVLTFGQYIIGAILTSSFIQHSLSAGGISGLGLMVIICSATKQHFHIDANAQTAKTAAKRLRSLVRYAQDQIAILEAKSVNGEDRTDAFITLLNELTERLSQIENAEPSATAKNELKRRSER